MKEDPLDIEEAFFAKHSEQKKKKQRIRAKKDLKNIKETTPPPSKNTPRKKGRVLSILSQEILLSLEGGETITSTLKGSLKKEKKWQKNLIVVGDIVEVSPSHQIERVLPRTSLLSRAENFKGTREQIIASNVDQVFITVSVVSPSLRLPLIDRYITAAKKGNMTPIIIVNKIDLLKTPPKEYSKEELKQEKSLLKLLRSIYPPLGFSLIETSITQNKGLKTLKIAMKGKTSLFSGQSGVGKSSLINELLGYSLKVGCVRDNVFKGAHTTSHSSLIPLKNGGFCVDTPGIRSFGMWDISYTDILLAFPDLHALSHQCKFNRCTHRDEPGCYVKKAVEKGDLSPLRLQSYHTLLQDVEKPNY